MSDMTPIADLHRLRDEVDANEKIKAKEIRRIEAQIKWNQLRYKPPRWLHPYQTLLKGQDA